VVRSTKNLFEKALCKSNLSAQKYLFLVGWFLCKKIYLLEKCCCKCATNLENIIANILDKVCETLEKLQLLVWSPYAKDLDGICEDLMEKR
jgi:hypothetical protein